MRASSSTVSPGQNPLAAGLVPTSLTGLFIPPQIVTGDRHAPRNAVSHDGVAQLICSAFPLKTRQFIAGIYPPAGALLASGLGFWGATCQ